LGNWKQQALFQRQMSYSMALRGFARMIVKLRMVYGVMGEVGEALLEPLLVVVREYVRYCADVSAMAGKSLAQPRPLRLLR
jgi:hypothetical protein